MSWQSNTSRMQDKLLYLLKSNEMHDVTVVVGHEKETFLTHKLLLSMFSEVFHRMFYGPMADETGKIALPEDNVDAFKIFLTFIYTDKVEIKSVDEAISSLYFADKYMVTYMKTMCSTYLKINLSPESVLKIYESVTTLQETELISICWKYIVNNISIIIKQDHICYASFETMMRIVEEDQLALNNELDMYNAVVKWGKHTFLDHSPENLRETLKPLLCQVRFLIMDPKDFVKSPCEDGILSKEEQFGILKELISSEQNENDNIHNQWRKPRNQVPNITCKVSCIHLDSDFQMLPQSPHAESRKIKHAIRRK